ncbi:plasmalemma vesicle associated protein b [Megalops cyprinoides]|uniref:plasmalemma vesicle associated protein b n=1 Tax=Megalops cyprinoides TaxID=118141 RepID=UPI001863F24C|nr:plasmalemma vesicle associated protein b [Megalops cyprinoides]
MYNSSYSRAKFGLEAKDIQKSKGKSCGYYMRIVFFFSSLIQSLIIVSLVLFLVYGRPEQSVEQQRVQDLEQSFERLSRENQLLRQQKSNLTQQLNKNVAEKQNTEKELAKVRAMANTTTVQLTALQAKMSQCEADKKRAEMTRSTPIQCPPPPQTPVIITTNGEMKNLQARNQQLETLVKIVEANFTQTVKHLRTDLESAVKARDALNLEAISLRRENSNLKEQLEKFTQKCKEDFVNSLEGIQTVTSAFLQRIENLFPHSLTFHLTCERQQEQLDRIRYSCSSLSREIEDRFQQYLNNVGNKVAEIQGKSSMLLVQNARLIENLQQCSQNRSMEAAENKRQRQVAQENNDKQMEQLLKEKNELRDQKDLQEQKVKLKESEIAVLSGRIQTLSTSCGIKAAGPKPAGLHAGMTMQQNRPNTPNGPVVGAPGISRPPVNEAGTGGTSSQNTQSGLQAAVNPQVKQLQENAKKGSEVSG